MNPIKLTIKENLVEIDYRRFISRCELYPDGGYYRESQEGKIFLVHPSHIREVQTMLSKLNIKPTIEIKQIADASIAVETGEKQRMPLSFSFEEHGVVVKDSHSEHFIPNNNISIILEMFQTNKVSAIMPRSIWSALVDAHLLFPELNEMIAYIKQSKDITQTNKDRWTTALFERKASALEGARTKKNGVNSYYRLYWFPILILKGLKLIDQTPPNREIFLTSTGKEFIENNDVASWIQLAKKE